MIFGKINNPNSKRAGSVKGSKRRAHYTVRVAERICEHIALGATLKQAIEKEPLGPTLPTLWRWMDEFPDFKEKYERARQMQADIHADRMLEMAAEVIAAPSKAAAYRVASDLLKWTAEIRDPKKYGAKVQHELKAPPLKPADLRAEIERLEAELGVSAETQVEPNPQHGEQQQDSPTPAPNPVVDVTIPPTHTAPEQVQ